MSHIVIDARESGTTTGRYIDNLIKHLHELDTPHRFTILTHAQRIEALKSLAPSYEIVRTDYKKFSIGEQTGLKKQLDSLKPDLVHFCMVQQPVLYSGRVVTSMLDLTAIRFKNPTKNPIIFGLRQQIYAFINKRVAKKSDAVICISEYVKNDIVNYTHINPDKITVTYNSADKITDKPQPIPALKGKRFIMYVGRPQPHKNLARLIDAFVLLQNEHPDLHLVLAGKKDPLYQTFEKDVQDRQIKNVVFTDFVTEGELRWLYENTACYVFPSLSEGFGLPGLEAMAHKAPVASSNVTCLPEIYGDAAAYFDPFDIKSIAVVVDKILTDSSYANKLRTLGSERVACFSWNKMAKQTLDVYDSVLNS